ncbi:serine carboxypeptidase-like protein 13, partial [Tanacetum coccineum]
RELGALAKTSVDISSLPQVQAQWCRKDNYLYCAVWANSKEVREALHIREEFGDIKWVRCNETLKSPFDKEVISYTPNVMNVVGYHRNLTD